MKIFKNTPLKLFVSLQTYLFFIQTSAAQDLGDVFESTNDSASKLPLLLLLVSFIFGVSLFIGGLLKLRRDVLDERTSKGPAITSMVVGVVLSAVNIFMLIGVNTLTSAKSGIQVPTSF